MAYLGDKAVGDIVKINENGSAVNYIIVHKGKPSDLYDDSCDGVWVLRQDIYETKAWGSSSKNDYKNSDMHTYLNGSFINIFGSGIKVAIKQAKIPYQNGDGKSGSIASGSSGLSAKIFLLSSYEVGFSTSDSSYIPIDGAKLSYFETGTGTSAKNKRIANLNGSAEGWWLRSPSTYDTTSVGVGRYDGDYGNSNFYNSLGVRPALIFPVNLTVDDDGNVTTNNVPTITVDKTGDLGTLDSGFSCVYSVDDADESDSVSVTLDLDDTTIKTFAATKNKQETYSLTGNEWLKTTNGSHTFNIVASDSKDSVTNTITFTRNLTELTATLSSPFSADDRISACALNVEGSIPADAVCKYEVTNNALDTEPVWEDCTKKSQAGFSYVFTNKTAENGFAFNFRVTISRGASGSGGYISSISGGFE